MTAPALALAAEQLAAGRRSVTRIVSLASAKAIARGRVPYLALDIEGALFDDLGVTIDDIEAVELVWHAHTGQIGEPTQRVAWRPGTPLPEATLFATCTVSAPLEEDTSRTELREWEILARSPSGDVALVREPPNVTAFPQAGDVLTVKQPGSEPGVSTNTRGAPDNA